MALSARGPRGAASLLGGSGAQQPLSARGPRRDGGSGSITPRSALGAAGGAALGSSKFGRDSGFRLGVHVAPEVQTAGKAVDIDLYARGLQPNVVVETPVTPDGHGAMQRRHRRRTGPGERSMHWGLKDAAFPDPSEGYGVKSKKDEGVGQVFVSGQLLGMAEYVNSRAESIYKTTVAEPLGKSYIRGHNIPSRVEAGLGFGKATVKDMPSKEAIFPRGVTPDTMEARALYRKTHGSFLPGESVGRNYTWPKYISDDGQFRFGHSEGMEKGSKSTGVKNALGGDNGFLKTSITNKTAEFYRQVADDQLGEPRNLMQNKQPVAPGHTYGVPSGKDNTSAGQLVQGFYLEAEQMPDHDLGRCAVVGKRNLITERHLGVPTVRTDMAPLPLERRSITNSTNFGDDSSAYGLICPNKFQNQGVADKDFQIRRTMPDLENLFEGAGHSVPREDFQMLFDTAVKIQGSEDELVSLELLMQMYAHWSSGGDL